MTRVKLGGRELSIPDELVTEYTSKGYSVIDARGNVLQSGKSNTYEQLIIENKELTAANKRLLDRVNSLESQDDGEKTAENAELKEKLAAVEKIVEHLSIENDALKAENEGIKAKLEADKSGDDQNHSEAAANGDDASEGKAEVTTGRLKCPHCDKDYATQENLDKHISTAHKDK